jgi:hypothetical protein
MLDNQQDGLGNEGTDEYVPAQIDPYEADLKAPLASYTGRGRAQVRIREWHEENRLLVVDADSPGILVLRLFPYPLWRVEVNGRTVETGAKLETGQMTIPVAAGESSIEIRFEPGRDRAVGVSISLLALVILAAWSWLVNKSRPRRALTSELARP